MGRFRWLHLSDLHFAYGNYASDKARNSFYEYIKRFSDQIDYIFITGDLRYAKQSGNEYPEGIDVALKQNVLDILKIPKQNVFIVPGNHDLRRNELRKTIVTNILRCYKSDDGKIDKEMLNVLESTQDIYKELHSKISENAFSFGPKIIQTENCNLLLLNTSICCGGIENEEGSLIIGMDLLGKEIDSIRLENKNKPTIVLAHHGMDFLHIEERRNLLQELKNINALIYLCGHRHSLYIENKAVGDQYKIFEYTCGTNMDRNPDDLSERNEISFFIGELDCSNGTGYVDSYIWLHDKMQRWVKNNNFYFPDDMDAGVYRHYFMNKNCEINNINKFTMYEKGDKYTGTGGDLPFNNERMNIYFTKLKYNRIIAPHAHNYDEIAFVMKGKMYVFIDDKIELLSQRQGITIPSKKNHSFVSETSPCEFYTISVTTHKSENWKNEINTILNSIRQTIVVDNDKNKLYMYNHVIKGLKSPILEIRWETIAQLIEYIKIDHSILNYLHDEVVNSLASNDQYEKFWGIDMIYEFCHIENFQFPENIIADLIASDDVIMQWICTYLLLKINKKIDCSSIYKKINFSLKNDVKLLYQARALIGILGLITNGDTVIFEQSFHDNLIVDINNEIKINMGHVDIVKHFIKYSIYKGIDRNIAFENYNNLDQNDQSKVIYNIIKGESEKKETFDAIEYLDRDQLLITAKCFFYKPETSIVKKIDFNKFKDNIKGYLRIIVGKECNLQCGYCHKEGRKDTISKNIINDNPNFELHSLLEESHKLKFKKIKISGGEPLLYPDIISISARYADKFDDIGFTTNGTLIANLEDELKRVKDRNLSFNVTLNSLDSKKYQKITGRRLIDEVKYGIDLLLRLRFRVKINTVITSYNFDDIESLIYYAAKKRVNIKLLDLVESDDIPDIYKKISLVEIKQKIMSIFSKSEDDFKMQNDYLAVQIMGIEVLIPLRIYSVECQYKCKMYPCAEGMFGIRIYEDYTIVRCFKAEAISGSIDDIERNVFTIRKDIDSQIFAV